MDTIKQTPYKDTPAFHYYEVVKMLDKVASQLSAKDYLIFLDLVCRNAFDRWSSADICASADFVDAMSIELHSGNLFDTHDFDNRVNERY